MRTCSGGPVYACPVASGRWLATGDPVNYLDATQDLKADFARIVRRAARELGDHPA